MRKTYNQPEVQVTEIQSMIVMQAASAPVGDSFNVFNTSTDIQW